MITPEAATDQSTQRGARRRERGVALMLVLAALALLSFLVVLVLTVARNEDRESKSSADIMDVRTLSDLPVQIAISQIRRATGDLKTDLTWTSQPGMIRRFASGDPDGAGRAALFDVFKLYSSDKMVELGTEFNAAADKGKIASWTASPALFTDLNEPVPLRSILKSGGGSSNPTGTKPTLVYPILDPGALKVVDGFEVADGSAPGASEVQPLPMPVMWLYVLKDGRVIAPTGGDANQATLPTNDTSGQNPVVGRIAFWTDDESCKINVNTAGEPVPWDEPRANSKLDRSYAAYQPAQNEFNRQWGHPAFTAVSPVFQSFGRDGSAGGAGSSIFTPAADPAGITSSSSYAQNSDNDATKFRDYVEANLRPLPRSIDSVSLTNRDRGSREGTQPPVEKVNLKGERLFSTIDELLFDTSRKAMKVESGGLSSSQTFAEADMRKARFFLTTLNSAPETNPFNRPKISLWPVQEKTEYRSKVDRHLALAASLSGKEFFWQRKGVWQSEGDPGSSQSTSQDGLITRNAELIGCLQTLASMTMPGYGGSLEAKYAGGNGAPSNTDQIITSMFDMLRWSVNTVNAEEKAAEKTFSYLPPGGKMRGVTKPVGEYSAVPAMLASGSTQLRGFGRFPTVTEVAFVLVATEAQKKGTPEAYIDEDQDGFADKTTKMRLFVILEPFCPVPGVPAMTPAVRYRISGLDKMKIENSPLFATDFVATNHSLSAGKDDKRILEGSTNFVGLAGQFLDEDGNPKTLGDAQQGTDSAKVFPFASAEITLGEGKEQSETLTLSGEPLTLEILPAFGDTKGDPVQTMRIPLPSSVQIPVPWLSTTNTDDAGQRVVKRFSITEARSELRQKLIEKGDVVRSVEADPSLAWKGDLRLLALMGARGMPPVTFKDDPDAEKDEWRCFFPSIAELNERFGSTNPNDRAMHSLRSGAYVNEQFGKADPNEQMQVTFDTGERLLPGFQYAPNFVPAAVSLPRGFNPQNNPDQTFVGAINAYGRLGDWSNGPGLVEDGPSVVPPQISNTVTESSAGQPGTGSYFARGGDVYADEQGVNTAPLRQISSAVAFGSLPSCVFPRGVGEEDEAKEPRAWQTLLFCPNPLSRQLEAGNALDAKEHFGFISPPDHMWLEFFWMPVTEPRPLSVGYSTSGKVNLNCQIMPFTYIKRSTALHAVMRGVRITAIPSSAASMTAGDDFYKNPQSISSKAFRYQVNATATVKGFEEERFNKGDVFRSASEICEMFLVPKRIGESDTTGSSTSSSNHDYGSAKPTIGLAYNKMIEWWNGDKSNVADAFEATGDNTRESPYAQLYPRLCTRSNVFRVHYRVQLIKKSRSTASDVVDLSNDIISADHRGSAVIERYIDPNDKEIPDMATKADTTTALDDFCRYRIVSRQPFTP